MNDSRQKNQLKLAFTETCRSEAPKGSAEGTGSFKAKRSSESPTNTERLMEEVCEQENCKRALKHVQSNKGSAGIDGITVDRLPAHLKKHWPTIREQLLAGAYQPQPVKRVEIPKPDGGMRQLGIPTAMDRFIQQAVLQVLQPRWDPTFSEHSYGFRPNRSAHQAVSEAQQYVGEGYGTVVDIDLEKFFDRVNHDRLMARLATRIVDKRMLKLIRAFLTAGVMSQGLVSPVDEGTPQGGPLSPLLSNIVLDELDRELEQRGHRFVRYADDCNIYVRTPRAGERVMKSLSDFIAKKLKLKVNGAKSAVDRPSRRKFLGFSFTWGREIKRRIAPKAIQRYKQRIRELTRRTRGVGIETMAAQLSTYLRGWQGYFGRCQTPSVLMDLEQWTRRRLRSVIWKQWKRGSVRFAELRRRGIGLDLAAQTAGSAHGPWRLANSPALNIALPNAYFDSLGLPRLVAR
jgi:RNA-directed DNA polymerase